MHACRAGDVFQETEVCNSAQPLGFSLDFASRVAAICPATCMGAVESVQEACGVCRAFHLDKNSRAGDALFWHGPLIQGGAPVTNSESTRLSVIVHFFHGRRVRQRS
jgi:hypothetical protein